MPYKYTVVDVTGIASFPAAPQVSLDFVPDHLFFFAETADGVIEFSFDGVSTHGRLDGAIVIEGGRFLKWPTTEKKCWFKRIAGAGTPTVRTTFWTAYR